MATLPGFPFSYGANFETDARSALEALRTLCLAVANEIETARDGETSLLTKLNTLVAGGSISAFSNDVNGNSHVLRNITLENAGESRIDHGVTPAEDTGAVAVSQTPSLASDLVLTGSPVITTIPRIVTVTVGGNESGVNATLYYTDEGGVSRTYGTPLPASAGTHEFGNGIWASQITRIAVSGGTAGNVSFGFDDSLIEADYTEAGVHVIQVGGDIRLSTTGWPVCGGMTVLLIGANRYVVDLDLTENVITTSTNVSANGTNKSFNLSAGVFSSVTQGDIIDVGGFANSALNTRYPVLSGTSSQIVVSADLATEAAGNAVTILRRKIRTPNGDDPEYGLLTALTFWTADSGNTLQLAWSVLE